MHLHAMVDMCGGTAVEFSALESVATTLGNLASTQCRTLMHTQTAHLLDVSDVSDELLPLLLRDTDRPF